MPPKAKKKKKKEETDVDWFEALDEELERKSEELRDTADMQNSVKRDLNEELIKDFWRIWIRFNKIDVLFSMEPVHSDFAIFSEFPTSWTVKQDFKFQNVNSIRLTDTTQAQDRIGDTIAVRYSYQDEELIFQMVFEFCEGEHYYKYAGWKRSYSQYILYESPADDVDVESVHEILGKVVKKWYESHLRKDRNIITEFIKDNFEKGKTFSQ